MKTVMTKNRRNTIEFANSARKYRADHAQAFELALYYITWIKGESITVLDSLTSYQWGFTLWAVRNRLPWGVVSECRGKAPSHRYRPECVSMPKNEKDPVILTVEGVRRVRWTLNHYHEHPAQPWAPDDTLYGRNGSGRKSVCEDCIDRDSCKISPVYTRKCENKRFLQNSDL